MHKAVRSKFFIMERIKEIPDICQKDWDIAIPDDQNDVFYSSLFNQVVFFQNIMSMNIVDVCKILGISTKSYEKYFVPLLNGSTDRYPEINVGRPPLVTSDDENYLINEIEYDQRHGNCMTPRQCRECLQNNIEERGVHIVLDREWWYNFRHKYESIISIKKVHSLENKRFMITRDQVTKHFNDLQKEIDVCPVPSVIINLDETGFIKRPYKNAYRNCVYVKHCSIEPRFVDYKDGNHISVVAAISLSNNQLLPPLLSTTINPPQTVYDSPLGNRFLWYKTPKGYLNEKAMEFWINNILFPYLNLIKSNWTSKFNFSPLLICDNLKAHLTQNIRTLLNNNGVRLFTFPPNSTHLLQALDLTFFSVMKDTYKLYQPSYFPKENKIGRKIEKILKAYSNASYSPIIANGWRESGFELLYTFGIATSIKLNRMRVLPKLYE